MSSGFVVSVCAVTPGVIPLVISPQAVALPLLDPTAVPSSLLPSWDSSIPSDLGHVTLVN